MAKKAHRTTLRSSTGKKLYAVRDAGGHFKDIQTFQRAHTADMRHKSTAELKEEAARQFHAPNTRIQLPGQAIPFPTPGSSHGSPVSGTGTSPGLKSPTGETILGHAPSPLMSKKPDLKKAVKPAAKPTPVAKPAAKKVAEKKPVAKVAAKAPLAKKPTKPAPKPAAKKAPPKPAKKPLVAKKPLMKKAKKK